MAAFMVERAIKSLDKDRKTVVKKALHYPSLKQSANWYAQILNFVHMVKNSKLFNCDIIVTKQQSDI